MLATQQGNTYRAMARARQRSGLTLIEVLIVVIVVAILAMIVVPCAMGAGRGARETSLRADLYRLRSAIEAFRADMGGHPDKLEHLVRVKRPDECRVPPNGHEIECPKSNYRGPYLTTPDSQLPIDPLAGSRDWQYDTSTGAVHSNAEGTGADGTPYASW